MGVFLPHPRHGLSAGAQTAQGVASAPRRAAQHRAGEENCPVGPRVDGRDLLLNSWPPRRNVTWRLPWSYVTPGHVAFALASEGSLQSSMLQSRTSGELSSPQMMGPAGS